MKREIIETKDGSKTIHLPELNESYHSTHGALQEAKHVFIKSGWNEIQNSTVSVLEIGFGSGLNALLTLLNSMNDKKTVHYTGLEAYPVSSDEISALNYARLEDFAEVRKEYELMHTIPWGERATINEYFNLLKVAQKMDDFKPEKKTFDLIYFDAFGPRVQPEMWTKEVLQKMYDATAPNGVFVTYCAKGEVRRNLISVGFEVEKIPGPPGKREMLRGVRK
ncbi:tRNA (5-methylaminomethyl-2-thiouridine)(34)-methyltransferase MnmD [Brumimicrobium sp.]|uniref:tRNA (5-methylaminomethyl-2-thiouridine)(34)-methyltransferase MnmD n=1 Tax=Brumimicrobium sp. TaxID=2029867 RepID=UPI003A919905